MKSFYLKNYKAIHHVSTFAFFICILSLLGLNEIFTSIPFAILILAINYFVVKYCLRISGLDEEVEKHLKEIEKK